MPRVILLFFPVFVYLLAFNLLIAFLSPSVMVNLALISSNFPIPMGNLPRRRWGPQRTVSCQLRNATASKYISVIEKFVMQCFASLSSSTVNSTPSNPMGCQSSYLLLGSPILWIGVGVGLSALFSVVATNIKRQAIRHAFKIVMGPDAPQNGEFITAPFSLGSPFPFPAATPVASEPFVKAEDPATNVEAPPPTDVKNKTEEVKEAMSHESNTPLSNQIPLASEPIESPVTVDALTTKIEAIPPTTAPLTHVEASPWTIVEDNLK